MKEEKHQTSSLLWTIEQVNVTLPSELRASQGTTNVNIRSASRRLTRTSDTVLDKQALCGQTSEGHLLLLRLGTKG